MKKSSKIEKKIILMKSVVGTQNIDDLVNKTTSKELRQI
jgi:hypothetical protein